MPTIAGISDSDMNNINAAVFHHEREIAELRVDPALAAEYLKAVAELLGKPDDHPAALLALLAVCEAYGGTGA